MLIWSCLFTAVQVQGLFYWNIKFNHYRNTWFHTHTHTHPSLLFTIVQVVQLEHRSNAALTWPRTSTWTHVCSGHQTHSWNSRERSSQNWLDGHCHMWQRFCVSTWGCSAFSIDRPNKSQWSEKEGMDGAGGGRDTHEWLADLCDKRGREQTERGMKHRFMTLTSVLLQLSYLSLF